MRVSSDSNDTDKLMALKIIKVKIKTVIDNKKHCIEPRI